MEEELLNYDFQYNRGSLIKVIGVGGAGCNAVNHMHRIGIVDVDFIICNTDKQSLENSDISTKIQLGVSLMEGRGAGNKPQRGEQAAIENLEDMRGVLSDGTKMVFITAGMGGGTGTGAAPVIAKLAKEAGILTIAVVTFPSKKEGMLRYNQAKEGVKRLKSHVDSLLVIGNENLHKMHGDLPARQAFAQADGVVATAVKGCAEIITLHGSINIDLADVDTVMRESKYFIMGTGTAEGEGRALRAVKDALVSPLLDSHDILGSDSILLHIVSGKEEIKLDEVGGIIDLLQDRAGDDANIIWGNGLDSSLESSVSVTIIATGFKRNHDSIFESPEKKVTVLSSDDVEGVYDTEDICDAKGVHDSLEDIQREDNRDVVEREVEADEIMPERVDREGEVPDDSLQPRKQQSWYDKLFSDDDMSMEG